MSKLLAEEIIRRCVMSCVKSCVKSEIKSYDKMKHKGFTLMEVLVSVAVAGLVISAGFRLIAMSYKLLGELQAERELANAAQIIWLRFRIDEDMPDNGTDDDNNITWRAEERSLNVEDYELKFKRVTITIANGRSTVIYVAQ